MTLKTNMAISLWLFVFLVGTIVLFGFATAFFPWFYFFFILIFLSLIVISIKSLEKNTKILALLLVVLVALSATFFASNLKVYFDTTSEFTNSNLAQINSLIAQNEYYVSYLNYTSNEIKNLQSINQQLQQKLNNLIISNPNLVSQQLNSPQTIILNNLDEDDD